MKKFVLGGETGTLTIDVSLVLLRIFAGLSMALTHGALKTPPPEKLVSVLIDFGLPFPWLLAWAAALSELVGGLLLAAGLFTRPAALLLSITMLVAVFIIHGSDPFAKKEMAALYLAIFSVFLISGSGRFSVDAAFRRN